MNYNNEGKTESSIKQCYDNKVIPKYQKSISWSCLNFEPVVSVDPVHTVHSLYTRFTPLAVPFKINNNIQFSALTVVEHINEIFVLQV